VLHELNSGFFGPSDIANGAQLALFRKHGRLVLEREIIMLASKAYK
jgi:hypothetical protein